MKVAAFVNRGTSTSFQVELSAKIDQITPASVSVVSFYDKSLSDVDPDVAELDMDFIPLGAESRFDVDAYRKLHSILHDFDILHTHYNFVGSVGRLASLGTDTKVVNTEHTDHRRFSLLQNVVNTPTYPSVDVMVYNSQTTRKSLRPYEQPFLTRSKSQVVYNGVDFSRVQTGKTRNDLPRLPDDPKIVTAARLVPVKNIEVLVQAMQLVIDKFPEAKLIIVGDGPQKEYLHRQAIELDVIESTVFTGQLEREQVYGTMTQCDVFAVPSLYEGFCNAAVEAMGIGLPVVASDIDVLREVIGESGLFADPTCPKAFAEHLIKVLDNHSLRTQLGIANKNRATTKFTIERSAQAYYKIYQQLSNG